MARVRTNFVWGTLSSQLLSSGTALSFTAPQSLGVMALLDTAIRHGSYDKAPITHTGLM